MDNQFANDIRKGLTNKNKFIPDRQYYDERGSFYFQELMSSPDYYVTNSELEIFENHKTEICNLLSSGNEKVKIIEFGAGDALKTKILLKEFAKNHKTTYYPIDFSKKYLDDIEKDFSKNMQDIEIRTINKDYFDALELIKREDNYRKIIFFIGSSLGGLNDNEIDNFFVKLSDLLNKNDILFLGFDLKKAPNILYKAYHNTCINWCSYLLQRINNEMKANFNLNKFEYYTTYNPENGKFKWYFISKEEQSVLIKKLDLEINFELGESIYIVQSKKFSTLEIKDIANKYGFKNKKFYFDNKHYYTDIVMIKE